MAGSSQVKPGHDTSRAGSSPAITMDGSVPTTVAMADQLFDRPILMGEADDEIAEEAVSGEAKGAEAYDTDEYLVCRHPETRVEYQIAKAGIRRDHLGGHHGCERIAHGQAHAGQDERQRRR